jgi:excisionase family DNA binding protein
VEALLTIKQAAQVLNVSTKTVEREIHAGRLQAVKILSTWRIDPADLRAYRGQKDRRQPLDFWPFFSPPIPR